MGLVFAGKLQRELEACWPRGRSIHMECDLVDRHRCPAPASVVAMSQRRVQHARLAAARIDPDRFARAPHRSDEGVLICPDIVSIGFSGAGHRTMRIDDTVAVFAEASGATAQDMIPRCKLAALNFLPFGAIGTFNRAGAVARPSAMSGAAGRYHLPRARGYDGWRNRSYACLGGARRSTRLQNVFRTDRRVLVTGGAGFLGSHLCERLLDSGREVLCIDNYFTGNRNNLARVIDHPSLETMRHDITFPLYVEVDEIYNLACPASPIHYQFDPVATTKVSVHGAINMLGLAKRTKSKILQASTSEVYGDPDVHPQVESYRGNVDCIGPRACYDEGKRCAETLFFDYRRQFKLPIKIARIFNTYGPRMHPDDGRVVSNFIVQALRGQDLTIYGDGKQTRSFCYVDDLIDGLMRLMATGDEVTGPVNLGNPHEVTVTELAQTVLDLTGSRSRVVHKPLPIDDPRRRRPDISLAKKLLDWAPGVSLEVGLRRTIDYFDQLLTATKENSAAVGPGVG